MLISMFTAKIRYAHEHMLICIPKSGMLMSTLVYTRKSNSMLLTMFKSILQDIGTYVGVLMSIPKSGKAHEHHDIHTKIMQYAHKHAHEHITGFWYIYERAHEHTKLPWL